MPVTVPDVVAPHTAVVDELWRVVYNETKVSREPGAHLYQSCIAFGNVLKRMALPHEAIRGVVDELMKMHTIMRGDRRCFTSCIILTSIIETLHVRLHTKVHAPAAS